MPRRPLVCANMAVTLDGRVSTRSFTPSDFSSPRDKTRLLEIRATADAVLVGAATLAADTMSVGLPDAELRARRIADRRAEFPLRVIVSRSGKLDPAGKVFRPPGGETLVFTTEKMPRRLRATLEEKCTLHCFPGDEVPLGEVLAQLRQRHGVRRVVCEGGPRIIRALVADGLLDELCLTICPRVFGGAGAPTLTGLAGDFFPASAALRLANMETVDGECFLRYRLRPRSTKS